MKKLIVNVLNIYKEKSRRRVRRRFFLFMVCLTVAFLSWLLNILGKTYRFEIDVPLHFQNAPQNKAVFLNENRRVLVTVEGTGWFFLRSKISRLNDPVYIDLRKFEGMNEINLEKNIAMLDQQIQGDLKVIDVFPKKLTFSYENLVVKKVPVKLDVIISFEDQYALREPIKISPDSVEIFGPENSVSAIHSWPTARVKIEQLNDITSLNVPLMSGDSYSVDLNRSQVGLLIPVEKYTEGTMEVPIQVKAGIDGYRMKLLPSVCQVSYRVCLSNYKLVKANMFKVVARPDPFDKRKLQLSLVDYPAFVEGPVLQKRTIDYLIQK